MRISLSQLQHFLVLLPLLMYPSTSLSLAQDLQTSRAQQGITCGSEKTNSHTWQRSAAGHCSGGCSGVAEVRPGNEPVIGSGFPDLDVEDVLDLDMICVAKLQSAESFGAVLGNGKAVAQCVKNKEIFNCNQLRALGPFWGKQLRNASKIKKSSIAIS